MFITHDLGTAAYLLVKSCVLKDVYINERKVYVFEFKGDKEELRLLAIDYINSECARFDSQVKTLKQMLR